MFECVLVPTDHSNFMVVDKTFKQHSNVHKKGDMGGSHQLSQAILGGQVGNATPQVYKQAGVTFDVKEDDTMTGPQILRNFALAYQVAQQVQSSKLTNAFVDEVLEKEDIASKVASIYSRLPLTPLAEILYG